MNKWRRINCGLWIIVTSRHKISNLPLNGSMAPDQDLALLKPPQAHNMRVLNKEFFKKDIVVSCIEVDPVTANSISSSSVIPFLLKMPKLHSRINGDPVKFLLHPRIKTWADIDTTVLSNFGKLGICEKNFTTTDVQLCYDNWNADDLIKAIVPSHLPVPRRFSLIGHILHLNLRDELLEYKNIIGEILLDKTVQVKTVVNKTKNIENTYRNFCMELICGEDLMVTQVKENSARFELDFSKVYWNPRLCTEHERIVDLISPRDVLFDVFCGVGPFAIPAAKKKCAVYANDLNPDSYHWLNHNAKLNKVVDYMTTFNKDGKDFIIEDIKRILSDLSKNKFSGKVHVTMNLPAMALEFVPNFRHLWTSDEINVADLQRVIPRIQTYFFVFGLDPEPVAKKDFETASGLAFNDKEMSYHFVRNVAPAKNMVRISWTPPIEYLVRCASGGEEPDSKKMRQA